MSGFLKIISNCGITLDTNMLLIIIDTNDKLFIGVNIDDLPKIGGISVFLQFSTAVQISRLNWDEMDGDRPRQLANWNCWGSRVSWALLKLHVSHKFPLCALWDLYAEQTNPVPISSVWVAGGLGVQPSNCFFNLPNTLSNYVLAWGQLHAIYIRLTFQFYSGFGCRKVQPPS